MNSGRQLPFVAAAVFFTAAVLPAGTLQAEEINCRGRITSIQGEGLIARTHRFEIENIRGADLQSVLEKCRKITQEKQNRAAGRNPGAAFRQLSEVDLQCVQGGERVVVRRSIRTTP